VLARKAFLNPACQNEVGLVAVVPRVLRLEPRRPLPDGRLSDHLAVSELIARQIDFHAPRKPIPHVRFRSLAVAEDVRRQDFSAKDVVQDQRRNVALPARGIARRPSIVLFRRIEAPAGSDGAFDLSERVHRTRVPTSGDIPERWPTRATHRPGARGRARAVSGSPASFAYRRCIGQQGLASSLERSHQPAGDRGAVRSRFYRGA